jgi:two-component sensor histidine kinase
MNVEDLYRLLRDGHMEAQGIVDTLADPMLVLDESLVVKSASRSFLETFNVDRYETIGQPFHKLGNGQWNIPELHWLLQEVIPKTKAVIDYKVEHDFPGLGRRTMLVTARTLHHPDHPSRSLLLSLVDATDRDHKDAAKDLLFSELRHRLKNLLGVAQAIARRTPTEGRSAAEFRDAFLGRFAALIETQDVAFADHDEPGLEPLIRRVLAPYAPDPETVVLKPGAACDLAPGAMMSLGLVLHELATNSAKYGALSVPSGRLHVGWDLEEAGHLRLTWEERDGPQVQPPSRTGYGTDLIKATVGYSMGGRVEQEYAPGGLRAEIVFPLGNGALPK